MSAPSHEPRTIFRRCLPAPWVFLAGVAGVVIAIPAFQIWWAGRLPLRQWLALTIVWGASIVCLASGLFETRRDRRVAAVLAVAGLALLAWPLLGGAFRSALVPDESSIWNWEGKRAPDFALRDLQGRTTRLSDLRGKLVLVHVWRPDPRFDDRILPYLAYASRTLGPEGLVVLGVSSAPLQEQARIQREFGVQQTLLFDDGGAPAPFNRVRLLNFGFLIDRTGRIQSVQEVSGLAAMHDLARAVRGPTWSPAATPIVSPPAQPGSAASGGPP